MARDLVKAWNNMYVGSKTVHNINSVDIIFKIFLNKNIYIHIHLTLLLLLPTVGQQPVGVFGLQNTFKVFMGGQGRPEARICNRGHGLQLALQQKHVKTNSGAEVQIGRHYGHTENVVHRLQD